MESVKQTLAGPGTILPSGVSGRDQFGWRGPIGRPRWDATVLPSVGSRLWVPRIAGRGVTLRRLSSRAALSAAISRVAVERLRIAVLAIAWIRLDGSGNSVPRLHADGQDHPAMRMLWPPMAPSDGPCRLCHQTGNLQRSLAPLASGGSGISTGPVGRNDSRASSSLSVHALGPDNEVMPVGRTSRNRTQQRSLIPSPTWRSDDAKPCLTPCG